MHNKKLILYGLAIASILIIIIIVLLFFLFPAKNNKSVKKAENSDFLIYKAVPSDAILICDFKENGNFISTLTDTSSFGALFSNSLNGLMKIQENLKHNDNFCKARTLYSLHYSSKNRVSFLQITDIAAEENTNSLFNIFDKKRYPGRQYNNVTIYNISDSICFATRDNILIVSNSPYILESSVRHLIKGASILDNTEFSSLINNNEIPTNVIYLRHAQIGKIFSGIISRNFWKYSDFLAKFSSWSIYEIIPDKQKIYISGHFSNIDNDSKLSTLFYRQQAQKTKSQEVIPANSLISYIIPIADNKQYLKFYKKFLGANKISKKSQLKHEEWLDSLNIEEISTFYCPIDGTYEWITAIKSKSQFSIGKSISKIFQKEENKIEPYLYKGYLSSLFGRLFGYCVEECYIKKKEWLIIGSKKAINIFSKNEMPFLNMDEYVKEAAASSVFNPECSARVIINLHEGKDTITSKVIRTPYNKGLIKGLDKKNFIFTTIDLLPGEKNCMTEMNIQCRNVIGLDIKRKLKEALQIDSVDKSNIKIEKSKGPFELKDFTSGGKCYIEQMPNNALQYYNEKKKAVWAIPFKTPLCGLIEQADLYNNNKLQMIFIAKDQLYALDRRGRFVNKYPIKLQKEVEYGPILIDKDNDKNYQIIVLNRDNTISLYDIDGNVPKGWKDINTPEAIYKLPTLMKIGTNHYWFLRSAQKLRIYTFYGKEITSDKSKRTINNESNIKIVDANRIKVKCLDGKQYIFNLTNSEFKKSE